MKKYYRIRLGKKNAHADECLREHFIGVNFGMDGDFSGQFDDNWKDFNKKNIPAYIEKNPGVSKISAGLDCGMLWTVAKLIQQGDYIVSPYGDGLYIIGEITGEFYYQPDCILPHRRKISWFSQKISKSDISEGLKNQLDAPGTLRNIGQYANEIEKLVEKGPLDENDIEDPASFAMEKHLEDFLVKNWSQTEIGKIYDIYEEGESYGQQYQTDTGPMDILAISKDKKTLLVVELKRGRASDVVVGQILRYMGFAKEELAEEGQDVKGAIIALEDDLKIRRALAAVQNIEFYRYQISFKLTKA